MPLSEAGKKALAAMKEQYGNEKGEGVFYAKENSDAAFRKRVLLNDVQRGLRGGENGNGKK